MSAELMILRVDKQAGRWEAVPVGLITDERLGFDTRAFAVWLMAKPDGWEIRAGALPYLLKDETAPAGHVGRDKARRFFRELERTGYLTRTRIRGRDGRWLWKSVFTSCPVTIDALAVDGSAVDGSSVDGKGVDLIHTDNYRRNQSTLNQPTAKDTQEVVGPLKGMIFPSVLSGAYRASAQALIAACPSEQAQAVLDEVAAVHARGTLRGNPIGLLHRLVERAQEGTFTPSYGVAYSDSRCREAGGRRAHREQRNRGSVGAPVHVGKTADCVMLGLQAKRKSSGTGLPEQRR